MKKIFNIISVLLIILILNGCTKETTNSDMLENSGLEIESQDVTYFESTKGYFAKPKDEGSYPGVIMIHEWWGLNDNIKQTADQLAKEGYIVLAVDLFKGSVATTSDEARQQTSSLNQEEALENLQSALNYIKDQGATKLASLGWCFGGGQSMQLALKSSDISATIIYYGNLVTDETNLSRINWPVLGVFGDQDQSIKVDTVKTFDETLDKLQIENEIYIYPGVGHAFANPSGMNYAPEETKDAWKKTLSFLDKTIKK